MSTLRAAFPIAYKGMGATDLTAIVNLWQRMFTDESYEEVSKAVDALISSKPSHYMPSVADVKNEIIKICATPSINDSPSFRKAVKEFWEMVQNGIDPITRERRIKE